MPTSDITDFSTVDRTQDPDFYKRFLDLGNQVPEVAASKPVLLNELRTSPGSSVLDVACGLGADVREIATRVGPTGRVVGVDASEAMIVEARARSAGLEQPVTFEIGDIRNLRFEDETFDACRSERTLMHVPNAAVAFQEIVRVTRRGGRIAVFDFDWDTHAIDSPDRETTRKITRSFTDTMKSGWIGRQLPRLFKTNGMVDVSVAPRTISIDFEFFGLLIGGHLKKVQADEIVPKNRLDEWWTHLCRAAREGTFLCTFTAFIVAGTRS